MGGAGRNEKKRRQEAANARLAAAGIQRPPQPNRTPLIVVAAVVAVALVVGLVLLWNRSSGEDVVPTYSATASGAVVTAGSGPAIIDVYEDYLCPGCERFEERDGDAITTALNNGELTVRYHSIAILDELTDPAGYSTRAANAALCAVPAGIFPAYHDKLFDKQPAEGSAGLSDEELIAFGTELGAQGDFAACVRDGRHTDEVAAETEAATSDPALQTDGTFGTPTVAVDGRKIDLNDASWLQDAIAAAR
ncbi:DsbA family protein [Pseudonocardia nigra]|uniref:DsbA family protein n=1 Tax=Pseudonocardia nigra TaxID=1921578 RepID=UPI001C5F5A7F|nr:thioredoxin domain-containing protein [Pseudonocardia nigra]